MKKIIKRINENEKISREISEKIREDK